jgi:hypothetical protein
MGQNTKKFYTAAMDNNQIPFISSKLSKIESFQITGRTIKIFYTWIDYWKTLEGILLMNHPAASSEVSPKVGIYFIVASDGVLDPQRCNKGLDHAALFHHPAHCHRTRFD